MGKGDDPLAALLEDESPIVRTLSKEQRTKPPAPKAPAPPAESVGGAVVPATEPKPNPKPRPASKPAIERGVRSSKPKPVPARAKDRTKRMKVTPEEERILDDLVLSIGDQVGARVTYSHIARAMWDMLIDAEQAFEKVRAPDLHRPANNDPESIAFFENELKDWLAQVIAQSRKL